MQSFGQTWLAIIVDHQHHQKHLSTCSLRNIAKPRSIGRTSATMRPRSTDDREVDSKKCAKIFGHARRCAFRPERTEERAIPAAAAVIEPSVPVLLLHPAVHVHMGHAAGMLQGCVRPPARPAPGELSSFGCQQSSPAH